MSSDSNNQDTTTPDEHKAAGKGTYNDNNTKPDDSVNESSSAEDNATDNPREFGGPKGPEPTRYGDWENKGQCIDF